MTLFIHGQELSKSFGSRNLFQELSLSVFSGDRVGLIGPNGSGKSTLLKILSGIEHPDQGEVSSKRGLKVGYVPQNCVFPDATPEAILLEALEKNSLLACYEKEALVESWLNKFAFREREISAMRLSGGWKKRLAIAKELIQEPDLLLLDEPTNHLDLEGIEWLEKLLAKEVTTYLLVSHDRYFLQNTTNRIVEIDSTYPKGMFSIEGSYSNFLEKKELFLEGQLERERSLASKARREVEWLRQSPKARTSKSKSRVEDAHNLLSELSQVKRRNQQKRTEINFSASERETRKLLIAKNIGKTIGPRTLFHHLDFTLSPGTRIGLMGPNGSGKTTLLRLLAGETLPDQGTLKRADGLKTVYFDQHRAQLEDRLSLKEALSPNSDYVIYHGNPIHINGWCKRFLFSPEILEMPIGKLSGGERARISIAHLMLQPADILLLDEPTNDLDIPTLEILEENLLDFPGAVVLISHDRCMLERLCNTFLALGNPDQTDLYADFSQWEEASKGFIKEEKSKEKGGKQGVKQEKLSYAEKKECEEIERKISLLEEEIQSLNKELEKPEVSSDPENLQALCTTLALAETRMEQLYLRWVELYRT